MGTLVTQLVLSLVGVGLFVSLLGWVVFAAISGRNIKRRLTDPAPIVM
jgi:hypothetical protein